MVNRSQAIRAKAAIDTLRTVMLELSYSPQCAELYARLLLQGPQSPVRIQAATGLGATDVHVAARPLIKDGLVFEDRDGKQAMWYCRDPATAWLSLMAEATWSTISTLRPLEELPATGCPEIDDRKALYLRALPPALTLWTPHSSAKGHKHTRAPNARILSQLAVEAVDLAQTHVRAISVSPKVSGVSGFWPVLQRRLKSGVTYTRITDVMEVYEHGLGVVARDLSEGVDLKLGLRAELAGTRGYLSDRRILVKYDAVPPGQRPESGVMTSDVHAIRRFVRRFNTLLSSALPAQPVLDYLGNVLAPPLREAAKAYGSDASAWVDEMIQMGRFARLPEQRGHCPKLKAE